MNSYRDVHVGVDMGRRYDALIGAKVDALIWENFVKQYTRNVFKSCEAAGATRYLDFACGTGRILEVGSHIFPQSVGIDLSDDMLQVARERVPEAAIYCVDVTRNPEAVHGKFDCVSLFRFLLNAEPPLREAVLIWLAAHMNPGSILVGNIHMQTYSASGIATVMAKTFLKRKINHLSRAELESMLSQTGFKVETWSGYRILPTIAGKPVLGKSMQLRTERMLRRLGLERFGSEQVFVARRLPPQGN